MKRFFFFIIILLSFRASAEVITMDLTTATDMNANPIAYAEVYGNGGYDCTDVWDNTYSDDPMCQFIYTNDARFMLSHMPSQNSYGGVSWEGFTLSKVSQDTANVFGCVANGGIAGKGTPYAIGYFSDWVTTSMGYSSNIILFDKEYYPDYIYVCQNSNTMEAIVHGGVYNARPFTDKDTLVLIISAIDSNFQETKYITYYLAIDGKMNVGWTKVSLRAFGKTKGLSFRMETTDVGDWGANTPMYFALDALAVNTNPTTNTTNIVQVNSDSVHKIVKDGEIYILRNKKRYDILGRLIE